MEAEAVFTVQQVAATAVMLYLCKKPYINFPEARVDETSQLTVHPTAPFAIDMISKIF